MYLLKCNKCNNLIEVKTEFLMLCPKCKSKLENNYQDWKSQVQNKNKNFPTYLEEVCISSDELEEKQRQERLMKLYSPEKNKRRMMMNFAASALAIGISIAMAIVLFFPLISGEKAKPLMLAINILITGMAGGFAVMMAKKRKRFQTFVPALISLAGLVLSLLADTIFLVLTDNV